MAARATLSDLTRPLGFRRCFTAVVLASSLTLSCSSEDADGAHSGAGAGSGASGNENAGDTGSSEALGAESELARAMLDAHNSVRSALEQPLPSVAWSEALAAHAAEWADSLARRCNGIHHRDQNPYGENIALRGSSRVTAAFSPEEAVAGWAAEAACWEFGTIQGSETCNASCVSELNSSGCGHYTQIVWETTERIGCGYAACQENFAFEIWVCNYDPPGNFLGRAPY